MQAGCNEYCMLTFTRATPLERAAATSPGFIAIIVCLAVGAAILFKLIYTDIADCTDIVDDEIDIAFYGYKCRNLCTTDIADSTGIADYTDIVDMQAGCNEYCVLTFTSATPLERAAAISPGFIAIIVCLAVGAAILFS